MHPVAHTIQEKRSLPPSRQPVHGTRRGRTDWEGPPLPDIGPGGEAVDWIVLRCTYDANQRTDH